MYYTNVLQPIFSNRILAAAIKFYEVIKVAVSPSVYKDNSIIVLSINSGAYATVFDANGAFVKRAALPARAGRPASVTQESLPASALTYLSTTYPNYVFKHAFAIKANGAVAGYAVFIDANATKYALEFDASGNFVKVITIR